MVINHPIKGGGGESKTLNDNDDWLKNDKKSNQYIFE